MTNKTKLPPPKGGGIFNKIFIIKKIYKFLFFISSTAKFAALAVIAI